MVLAKDLSGNQLAFWGITYTAHATMVLHFYMAKNEQYAKLLQVVNIERKITFF
jgi:hypothetical protein